MCLFCTIALRLICIYAKQCTGNEVVTMTNNVVHEVPAKHLIAAVLQSDSVLGHVQREILRLLPGISIDALRQMLREELLRPEAIEGPQAQEAQLMLDRMAQLRSRGLTMTQTLNRVPSPTKTDSEDDDDAFHIMINDKRSSGGAG